MSNTVNNTHRRSMRTVTPVVRAGRATAGAAMAAAMLFGGAAAATAEPQAEAPVAPQAGPAVIAPVAAPAVEIPVAGVAADVTTADATTEAAPTITADAPSFASAGGSISVEVGPTEAEIAAAEAAAEEERAAEEAAQAEAAEAEAQDQQQTETRDEDDSADRSNERTGTSNDSTESNDSTGTSSSSNNSGESSSSRESSSSSDSSSEKKKEKSAPAPSASKGSSILATARSGIGTPYVFGGTSTSGWDCSGFVQWVYAQHGIDLPRGANAQGASGTVIPRSEAKPGDLVYKPGHIGIYAGGNKFVDAGNSRVDTTERNIYSGSWTFVRVGS